MFQKEGWKSYKEARFGKASERVEAFCLGGQLKTLIRGQARARRKDWWGGLWLAGCVKREPRRRS